MKRLIILLMMTLTPMMVRSEFFIDVFGGRADTHSGSFSATEDREAEIPGGELTSQGDLSGASSGVLGLRGGYWIGAEKLQWLGAAVDLSGFQADAQDTDADVAIYTASLILMFRYPVMISEEYAHGRFYPYAGIGALIAVVDISGANDTAQGMAGSDVGGMFCAGVKWMFTPKLGLFAEYRALSFSFDDRDVDVDYDPFGWSHTRVFEAEGDVTTHQLLGGVSYHF
jgi:hypothetical protein